MVVCPLLSQARVWTLYLLPHGIRSYGHPKILIPNFMRFLQVSTKFSLLRS